MKSTKEVVAQSKAVKTLRDVPEKRFEKTEYGLSTGDIPWTVYKAPEAGKIGIISFGNYKHPGKGLGLKGDIETQICEVSNLGQVLNKLDWFYKVNRANENDGMYLNRTLCVPNVTIDTMGCEIPVNIYSVSLPGKQLVKKGEAIVDSMVRESLRLAVNAAAYDEIDTLILPMPVSVFKHLTPSRMMHMYKKRVEKYDGVFKNIVYVIADDSQALGDNSDIEVLIAE